MTRRAALQTRYAALMVKIEAAEASQSATLSAGGGSRSFTRGNLDSLYRERDRIVRAINAIDRGGRHAITRVRIETA